MSAPVRCVSPAAPAPRGDGVLVVDKPRGPTSHEVVAAVRRWTQRRDVGHAGTLDPLATGVLVVLVGEATKLSAHLTAEDKRYVAEIGWGTSTDTDDADGTVTATLSLRSGWLDASRLAEALSFERERQEQVPPAFSAIKVAGRAAHRLSRAGRPPELPPRPVRVRSLELRAVSDRGVSLELVVSKGYYVRSLARDLGAHLGVPAHLATLRRIASGAFTLDDAIAWPPTAPVPLLPMREAAGRALTPLRLTNEGVVRARRGQPLGPEHFEEPIPPDDRLCAWTDAAGELVALGRFIAADTARVVRGFRPVLDAAPTELDD